jgi:siroheme synthase
LKDGSAELDWAALARPRQTVVVYMGVGALAQICAGLVSHGLPAGTPAALVEKATWPAQRIVEGTLATLAEAAAAAGVKPPALLIVGEVVRLRARLAWFAPAREALEVL